MTVTYMKSILANMGDILKNNMMMIIPSFVILFSFPAFAGSAGTVAVFASEKIMGKQIRSFFSSIGRETGGPVVGPNECEGAIGEKLLEAGFVVAAAPSTEERIRAARKLSTVFGRYANIGMMPNDTAAQAAAILENGALSVVVCGVVSENGKKGQKGFVCADAECKVVDMKTKKRIVATAFEKCLPGVEGISGGVAAIRKVCLETGGIFAGKIRERYPSGD